VPRRRHRQPQQPREAEDRTLRSAPVHLDAAEERGALGGGEERGDEGDGRGGGVRVLRRRDVPRARRLGREPLDESGRLGLRDVHRQLEQDRLARGEAGAERVVDGGGGGGGVEEKHGRDRARRVGLDLRVRVVAERVVRQRPRAVAHIVGRRRRARQDDERYQLGEGAGAGVERGEAADPIRHAAHAEARQPRVRVGRVAAVELVARPDPAEAAADQLVAEAERVVAGDAEDVADTELGQARGQVGGHRHRRQRGRDLSGHRLVSRRRVGGRGFRSSA
jgi:hypothetical protein